jgi:O-antigen ligase
MRGDVSFGLRPVHVLAGLAALAAALVSARVVAVEPRVALAAPLLLALAVVAARAPAAMAVGLVAVAGAAASVFAFTAVSAQWIADALLAALWLATAASLVVSGPRREQVVLWPGIVLLALFLALSVLALAGAPSVGDGLRSLRISQWLMTALILPVVAPWTPATRQAVLRGTLAVGLAGSAYACVRYVVGPAADEFAAAVGSNQAYRDLLPSELPLHGSFNSPKTLGLWCAIFIPPAFALLLTARGPWRAVAGLTCATSAVALFGSQTRTALVAVVAGLVAVVAVQHLARALPSLRLGGTLAAVAGAAALLAAGFAFVSSEDAGTGERFGELAAPGQVESFRVRQQRWSQALDDVRGEPLGRGPGTASIVARFRSRFADDPRSLDSSYVKIASEQGIQVLVFIAALLLLFVQLCRSAATTARRDAAIWGAGAAGVLAAMAVLMYATIAAEQLPAVAAWLIVGVAIAELSRRPAAEPRQRPQRAPAIAAS